MSETGAGTETTLERWDSLARAAAAGEDDGRDERDLLQELLTFEVGGVDYALPIERVREILRIRPITPVPRLPDVVLGVITIRGEVVQVLDLRRRMGLVPEEPGRRTRIIVVLGMEGSVTGVMVDRVNEVLRVRDDAIHPAPETDSENVVALCSRGDEFVSMIDLDRILTVE